MDYKNLANEAIEAKKRAKPTYSGFHVGAALLTNDDKVYIGGNIESSSYGLTICAERTAVFTAIIDNAENFKAIAIAGDAKGITAPCGACRQVLLDQCGPELDVVLAKPEGSYEVMKLKELLPLYFDESSLKD